MLLATFHAVEFAVDKPDEEPLMFKSSIRHAAVYGLCFEALVAHLTHGQSVKTVEMQANSVGRTLSYVVALPMEYSQSSQRYPVLYMLHGFSSNYTQWFRLEAHKCAKDYPLILVMPDAGNSWYINWRAAKATRKTPGRTTSSKTLWSTWTRPIARYPPAKAEPSADCRWVASVPWCSLCGILTNSVRSAARAVR